MKNEPQFMNASTRTQQRFCREGLRSEFMACQEKSEKIPSLDETWKEAQWSGRMELIGYILLTGGIITVVVFLFHCVIWLIKLFADISWDTWAWTKYCFWGTLVVALLAFIYRVATYFYAKYRHSENERLNNLPLQLFNELAAAYGRAIKENLSMSVPKTGLLPENPNLFEQQLEEICLLGDKIFQLHTGIAKTEQKIKSLPEQEAEQYLETVFDDYIAQKRELQSLRRQ